MNKIIALMLLVTFYNSIQGQDMIKKTLFVGDEAPEFHAQEWIKGNPVDKLDTGTLYVIEFMTLGCPPCRKYLPHLTELQEKYGDSVRFITLFQDPENHVGIKRFIELMGDKLNHSIGLIDTFGKMKNDWLIAYRGSRLLGSPSGFVVNRKGIIEWTGNPIDVGFDGTLEKIYQNKYSPGDDSGVESVEQRLYAKIRKAKDDVVEIKNTLKELDSLIALYPYMAFDISKFSLLLMYDEKKAYAYAKSLMTGKYNVFGSDVEHTLLKIALEISSSAIDNKIRYPDWDLVITLTRHARKISDMDIYSTAFSVEAKSYAMKGQYQKAAEVQKKAVDAIKYFPYVESRENYEETLKADLLAYQKKNKLK